MERGDAPDLRTLGPALSSLGIPWLLSLLSQSGLTMGNGMMILPFLWFAPPFVVLGVRRAAAAVDGPARGLLSAAWMLGLLAWVVAVPASLAGNQVVTRSAHWVGVAATALLYCAAMLLVTQQLAWPEYARRWRVATIALAVCDGAAVLATVTVLATGATLRDGRVDVDGPWGLGIVAVALMSIVALLLLAQIHRATWSAMSEAP